MEEGKGWEALIQTQVRTQIPTSLTRSACGMDALNHGKLVLGGWGGRLPESTPGVDEFVHPELLR